MLSFPEWVKTVPKAVTGDTLWRMEVYRMAEYLGYLAFDDTDFIAEKRHRVSLADQLYRAVGSISANIAEGYGDANDKDQTRFYRYALRSAREARSWYLKARPMLTDEVSTHRFSFLESVIRSLIHIITVRSGYTLREEQELYDLSGAFDELLDQ
jgi:four helix bundle protein